MRLVRAFKFFEVLKVRRLISEEGYFLLTFTNIYLIFINFVSCIFFLFTGLVRIRVIILQLKCADEVKMSQYFSNQSTFYFGEILPKLTIRGLKSLERRNLVMERILCKYVHTSYISFSN